MNKHPFIFIITFPKSARIHPYPYIHANRLTLSWRRRLC